MSSLKVLDILDIRDQVLLMNSSDGILMSFRSIMFSRDINDENNIFDDSRKRNV